MVLPVNREFILYVTHGTYTAPKYLQTIETIVEIFLGNIV